MYDDKLYIAG